MANGITAFGSPIPLSDIEAVLAWVDRFKLSRPTKKINRDFSDAVLLAEILALHYPKLVEMHNYPPRNSHSLKLNNWMTLNRKVLKKLRLNLCCNTMEQLANSAPGVIERVLIMVRDRIRRDEEVNKATKDAEQNVSSGGSYYEACGPDEENVLVIPLKMRVNGVLETVQQKVVSHEIFTEVKQELQDAKDTADLLKQKVEHLDTMLKLKDERIEELQKQLDRKQQRRKDVEAISNHISVPFDEPPPSPIVELTHVNILSKTQSLKTIESNAKIKDEETREQKPSLKEVVSFIKQPSLKSTAKPSISEVNMKILLKESKEEIERIKSDVFKEAELLDTNNPDGDTEEFKDSEAGIVTIGDAIDNEILDITTPPEDDSSKDDSNYYN